MIKENELKIGNFIHVEVAYTSGPVIAQILNVGGDLRNGVPYHGEKCGVQLMEGARKHDYAPLISTEKILPIPLTEEWLQRMGFNRIDKEPDDDFEEMYEDSVGNRIDKEHGVYKWWHNDRYYTYVELKTVHQLQNLFFALTGEELIVKI